jgi:hypothetical protein
MRRSSDIIMIGYETCQCVASGLFFGPGHRPGRGGLYPKTLAYGRVLGLGPAGTQPARGILELSRLLVDTFALAQLQGFKSQCGGMTVRVLVGLTQ